MNVLLTSAGRRSYLVRYFQKVVSPMGGLVHAGNTDGRCSSLSVADRAVVTPRIHSESYIPFLLDYCHKHCIQLIVPLFDLDLTVLAAHRDEFQRSGVVVVVSGPEVIEICNDKWKTAEFLRKHGFPHPETTFDLEDATKKLESARWMLPLVIKPRSGMGSLGVEVCFERDEIPIIERRVRRTIATSYLQYEQPFPAKETVLFQQFVYGQEYGLDILNDLNCEHQCVIVKEKTAMRAGETDSATVVKDADLQALGMSLGRLLRHRGNLDVDILRSDDGKCFVLDMNARLGGHYPFSHLAGADFPALFVMWALGREIDKTWMHAEPGVSGLKDIGLIRDNAPIRLGHGEP